MRVRRTSIIALAAAAVLGLIAVTHVQRYESSLLFVTHHASYDVLGEVKEQWNALVRNCESVSQLGPKETGWNEVSSFLNSGLVPQSGHATPLRIFMAEGWYLIEANFESLEPALLLLSTEGGTLQWHEAALFSGTAAPLVAGPVIRDFIRSRAPATPEQLLRCFKPSLAHFAAAGPNPSLKPSPNGKPPGPVRGALHSPQPGPGGFPSGPA